MVKRKRALKSKIVFGLVALLAAAIPVMTGCMPGELGAAAPGEETPIMNEELAAFVDEVYKEPYSLVFNNCIDKSLRIMAKAESLGMKTDLIGCIAIVSAKRWHNLPIVSPHFYAEIEGKKVDVALDPVREEIYCKNSEVRIVMPVNISEIGRAFCRRIGLIGCLLRKG